MRTISTRHPSVRYKGMSFTKEEPFKMDLISMMFWVIAMIVFGSLYQRTIIDEPGLTFFDSLFIVMLVIGLIFWTLMIFWMHFEREGRGGVYLIDLKSLDWRYLVAFLIAWTISTLISILARTIQALTSIEQVLFFTFVAVAEEFFYRGFITSAIYLMMNRYLTTIQGAKKTIGEMFVVIISVIVSVFITSIYFFYSHFTAYGEDIRGLIAIFGISLVYTMVYVYTKSLLPSILAHVVNNFIVALVTFIITPGAIGV